MHDLRFSYEFVVVSGAPIVRFGKGHDMPSFRLYSFGLLSCSNVVTSISISLSNLSWKGVRYALGQNGR